MAIVFLLRAFHLNDSVIGEQRLRSLPIRIGRNALADFQLLQGFISDFHALIEDVDGRLYIRDLNSKNGVYTAVAGQRLPVRIATQSPVDLASCGFQFFLGVHVRVTIQFEQEVAALSARASTAVGSVLGNQAVLSESGGQLNSASAGAPLARPPTPLSGFAAPGGAWGAPPSGASGPAPGLGANALPPLPVGLGSPGPSALPPLGGAVNHGGSERSPPIGRSGFDSVSAPSGWSPEPEQPGRPHTGVLNLSLEAMALLGLRELAGSLAPGRVLNTTGDVARFITKLHDTVEVFCRCFIPLREGYSQFVSSLDLQKAALQRSMLRSPSYVAVETARDPAAVAAALLDWRDRSMDGPRAIEGIFADLMIHQVALLDGVMQGVRALLDQLAPHNIEQQVGPPGPFALDRTKARYKALWETYSAHFEELAEEKQAFTHIFGPQFTEAYREYRKQRVE